MNLAIKVKMQFTKNVTYKDYIVVILWSLLFLIRDKKKWSFEEGKTYPGICDRYSQQTNG